MKYFISFIMIVFILSSQFSEVMLYISFKINQDYIAKNLCIEKDVEGSTCMGCCQLKKRMNEQQEQKKEFPLLQNLKQDFTFYVHADDWLHFIKSTPFTQEWYAENYEYTFSRYIFHPPQNLS